MPALTLTVAALVKITDMVFGHFIGIALDESGATDAWRQQVRKRLGKRSPEQLAFRLALERALKRLDEAHAGWVGSLFDERTLADPQAATELARLLARRGEPDAEVLAEVWARNAGTERPDLQAEAVQVAADFVVLLDEELDAPDVRPKLAPLRNSRDFASILTKLDEIDSKLPSADARAQALHKKYLQWIINAPWTKISMSLFTSRKDADGVRRKKISSKPVNIAKIYTPLPVDFGLSLRFDKKGNLCEWWVGKEKDREMAEMAQKSVWERMVIRTSGQEKTHMPGQRSWPEMGLDEVQLQSLRQLAIDSIGKKKEDEVVFWQPNACQAAQLQPRFVLVGDPGSGKSTFLCHLAFTWAEALLQQRYGRAQGAATPPQGDKVYTPIYIELRSLVTHFPSLPPGGGHPAQVAGIEALDKYLEAALPASARGEMIDLLHDLLERGEAALLLDGLDEISQGDDEHRRDQIQEFVAALDEVYGAAPIIVTARPYAYRQHEWQLEGFGRTALAPMSRETQVLLAQNLFGQIEPGNAKREAKAFVRALDKIPSDLCSNPLLLTLLIVIWLRRAQGEHELPDTRGELYRRALMFLLDDWVKIKQDGTSLFEEFNLDADDLHLVLQLVAARAQEKRKKPDDEAVITRGDFFEVLDDMGRDEIAAPLIKRLKKQAGMLLDMVQESPGPLYESYSQRFRFLHLSFQEHLTACEYLYRHEGDQGRPPQLPVYPYRRFPDGLVRQVIAAPDLWHNVLRLAIDELIYKGRVSEAWQVLTLVCQPYLKQKEAPLAALLALEIAEDIELFVKYRNVGVGPYYDILRDVAAKALTDVERFPDPKQRDIAGRLLGRGDFPGHDPRPGVDVKRGLPDFDWVHIPAGEFTYQDGKRRYEESFWITRYPVTYAQFKTFLRAEDGFHESAWWNGLAASESHRRSPGHQRFEYWNHPRERVSWYDAIAFSRWLTAKIEEHPELLPQKALTLDRNWRITLPTEWQWERAARGNNGLEYPWGSKYRTGYANIDEKWRWQDSNHLKKTNAVGMYPDGSSQECVLDMSGNVWEWCLNEHENPQIIKKSGSADRVLRGGSWNNDAHLASTHFRNGFTPDYRSSNIGFRLVVFSVPQ